TYLEEIVALNGKEIVARRNVGNGYEVVECKLPVLLTVTDSFQEPRPCSAKALMKYKHARATLEIQSEMAEAMPDADEKLLAATVKKRAAELKARGLLIEQWNLDDIEADLAWCGRDGSPTKVKRIQSVVLKGSGHEQFEPTDQDVARLVHQLIEDHTIG
ncbi:MAG: electron transfer flavoprotein beta subunit/FixA family protein, partial [Anaerolineaceae bacterium]|nr:electron transfer flavoprotein beta subunit/FixA family protein [Anaerolineaceae bacterium]